MFHINRIVIDGFITKNQRLEFNFAKGNVTVIYGINGSGKTTLLEILYAIFAQNGEILLKNNVLKIELEFQEDERDIEKLIITKKDNISDENISADNISDDYFFSKNYEAKIELFDTFIPFQKSKLLNLSTIFLGIYRGINIDYKIVEKQTLWKFFQNNSDIKNFKNNLNYITCPDPSDFIGLFEDLLNSISEELYSFLNYTDEKNRYTAQKIEKELNHNFSFLKIEEVEIILEEKYEQTIKKTQSKIGESLFSGVAEVMAKIKNKIDEEEIFKNLQKNQDLILKALDDDNKDDFKNQIEEILQGDIDNFKNQESLIKIILSNLLNKLENETIEYNKLQLFVNEFNSFIKENNKKVVINSKGIKIKLEDSSTHSLNKLSSGERNMLTFLATILLLGESRDFILIDEPEISLDTDWQEKLLSTIEKLAPNSQIIVASHSSVIWGEYFDETIEILPIKKS
jgi:energy-coupling factor transporter ATP-binding protein EcfA2